MRGTCASCGMVVSFVCASAQWAYEGAFADRAAGDRVIEGMALVTASEDEECSEFFYCGGATEEGGWVPQELGEARAIGVNKGEGNGGISFLEGDGVVEPLGRADEGESFTCQVTCEFFDEEHGGGDVAFVVTLDWDAMDYNFGIAFLRDYMCASAKGRGEDGPVPVYLVIGWLACEGQDKVVGKARAPSPGEEGNLGWAATVGLVDGSVECSHYFHQVKFLGSHYDLIWVGEDSELGV